MSLDSSDPAELPRYAHSLPGEPRTKWETMPEHSRAVATRTAAFAARFGAEQAGRAIGILHDIGKVSPPFQVRIGGGEGSDARVDHSTAGAVEAERLYPAPLGRLFAFQIAGHHAGLADWSNGLEARLARAADLPDYRGWEAHVPELPAALSVFPGLKDMTMDQGYRLAFFGRMLFSCLVDADFLETERFYAEAKGEQVERGSHTPLPVLRDRLDTWMRRFDGKPGTLNELRARILAHARAKAEMSPGLFTMTVPTGGGKTLAGLAFALDHAVRHGLDRVVYVIPYTSIIEQTAGIFREALAGPDGHAPDVLEHHGTVDWDGTEEDRDGRDALAKLRRASDNWDVPVVVTTAVQFFESLHANRTSRCRKLHNLARSVVVLDEAQMLPVHLLRPCIAAIDELARNYGASVVLCTATQPALRAAEDGFRDGLVIPADRELAPDPAALYEKLKRVALRRAGPVEDVEIAERFAQTERMLCIVNSRRHAQAIHELIKDMPGARHLSTLMCPAHRRIVLAEARVALAAGEPVRLVSTSLIEAGVDVDFPEVWRAETGLDSIAQAAGRCNREGGAEPGRVVVFEAADHRLPDMFRQQVAAAAAALRLHPEDPLGLDAVREYFRLLYWSKGDVQLDAGKIGGKPWPILPALKASFARGTMRLATPFASVAKAFVMIDDPGKPVIVPWDEAEVKRLCGALRSAPKPPGDVLRRLQQYTVTIPERAYREMLAVQAIQPVAAEYGERFMLVQDVGLYADRTGLSLDPFGGTFGGVF